MPNPFRYFNSSPEVIRLVVVMYVKYPLSLRNVEALRVDELVAKQIAFKIFAKPLLTSVP